MKGEGAATPSSDEIAWAARGLGILGDEESAADLVLLAASSDVSVSVQALTALSSLSKKNLFSESPGFSSKRAEPAVFPSKRLPARRGDRRDPPPRRAARCAGVAGGARREPPSKGVEGPDGPRRPDAPRRSPGAGERPRHASRRRSSAGRSSSASAPPRRWNISRQGSDPLRVTTRARPPSDPAPRVRAAALSSLSKKSQKGPDRLASRGPRGSGSRGARGCARGVRASPREGERGAPARVGSRLSTPRSSPASRTSRSARSTPPPRGARQGGPSSPPTRTMPTR